jgi:hypothetical protein
MKDTGDPSAAKTVRTAVGDRVNTAHFGSFVA